MSEQGTVSAPTGSAEDRETEAREVDKADQRNVMLSNVDLGPMALDLRDQFDRVMSGKPYDEGQIKNATNLTNTIVKVLRFEFDVYKHFTRDPPRKRGRPSRYGTVADVATWLRRRGDTVEKANGVGRWVINGRPCEEKDLLSRANNLRTQNGQKPFEID
jgi:hypothetical protein